MGNLKLIMAVGRDGYMARSPSDTMTWTGRTDKTIFKLLTSVGGEIGMSRRSAKLLPPEGLPGRKVIQLSRADTPLGYFASCFPDAWLGAGQELADLAFEQELLGSAYICHIDRDCCGGNGLKSYPHALVDPTRKYLYGGEARRLGWHLDHTLSIGEVTVCVHKRRPII